MRLLSILLILLNVYLIDCKSTDSQKFHKYSYKSNFTDADLFQSTYTRSHLNILKSETRHLFEYAWDKYMEHGFPHDEVTPLTCRPNLRDHSNPQNTVQNDALGGFSITFIDALDTWIVMGNKDAFTAGVKLIAETYVDFDINSTIQVFETNIRLLGSLLTAHLHASDPRKGFAIPDYDGFLLKLAYDLGKRLVVSFHHPEEDSKFDNPLVKYFTFNYPRTNLADGHNRIMGKLKQEQCTAGITSLSLEFALLSRLTNDTIFEDVSRRAVLDVWANRSKLDLVPMTFDTGNRMFVDSTTGIGASIDSFYEYALKYAILFDDDTFMDIWEDSYRALLTHSQNSNGMFTNVDVASGMAVGEWIDSLAAFFPGLQVLAGDISNSEKLHKVYFKLWNNYNAIPERWNFMPFRSESHFQYLERAYKEGDVIQGFDADTTNEILVKNSVGLEWYPLRPEFIESTYHLYRATKDPFYLRIGEDFLEQFRKRYIAPCGFSGVHDIIHDIRQDRQESFVLSETLKYLYLLFDVDNEIQTGNSVFTTEAHLFWYDKHLHEYNALSSDEVFKMNIWNETQTNKQGFLNRLVHGEPYNLNKQFASLKKSFNENIQHVDPIIYRVKDINAFEVDENNEKIGTFGKRERMSEVEYREQKRSDNRAGTLLDPQYLKLDVCEVPQKSEFGSLFLSDPDFYKLDWYYAMTLRKPMYLIDEPQLELDQQFYQNFILGMPMCAREQQTSEWEALISVDQTFSVAPIYRHRQTNSIFVKDMEGLRLRFENLKAGEVDSRGDIVTGAMRTAAGGNLRLVKMNGLDVSNQTVWVNDGSRILREASLTNVYSDGKNILIGPDVIANMLVVTPVVVPV